MTSKEKIVVFAGPGVFPIPAEEGKLLVFFVFIFTFLILFCHVVAEKGKI